MKSFKQFNEVAPPGWGHTKAEKEKTDPSKPKSKIGGTAAAFKRALDDGRFKGLPGDKTKKEKTASMFKLMWSMKKKGDKPHYKPGTDKKYEKYQEDWKPEIEVIDTKARAKKAEKKRKEAESSLPPHLKLDVMKKAFASESSMPNVDPKDRGAIKKRAKNLFKKDLTGEHQGVNESLSIKDTKKLAKASALSHSDDPKDQDRARARQVEIDYKDLMRQRKKGKVGVGKSMKEEKKLSPMQDNNLFGNAYAGSQRQKKKAIDAIPDKSSEVYNRNLKHKSPTNPRESIELLGADGKVAHEIVDIIKPEPMKVPESPVKWKELTELRKLPNYNKTGNIIDVYLTWRGRTYMIQMFFPQVKKPSRKDVIDQLQKVYPGSKIHGYEIGTYNPGEPVLQIN